MEAIRDQRERWLVLMSQSGDLAAFDELLRRIQQPLHGYLARLLGNASEADDVMQDVMLILYRKLRWLNDPSLFRPWMFRIASREALRRLRRTPVVDDSDDALAELTSDTDLENAFLRSERAEQLSLQLDTLPAMCRAVILLHYFEQLSLREVAEVLDLKVGTVKSRLNYGLSALRKGLCTKHPE